MTTFFRIFLLFVNPPEERHRQPTYGYLIPLKCVSDRRENDYLRPIGAATIVPVELSFWGGAGTVTGSRYLMTTATGKLLVDCGLFQGKKELRRRNWQAPGFAPQNLSAAILTHAHIDHSGYFPRLVSEGFQRPIFVTPATADLADLLLRDSAKIQEEDAAYANRKGFSKHRPALPLYTVKDADAVIRQLRVVDYGEWFEPMPHTHARFVPAGHIIGSGMVEAHAEANSTTRKFLFSGDIGRFDAPLVPDPTPPPECDYLIMESTYGDRRHPGVKVQAQLKDVLQESVDRQGIILIAAFAVGRSQQLLYLLHEVMSDHPHLDIPIHLDSPMAVDTTKIYERYPEEHGLENIALRSGAKRLYGSGVYLHRSQKESIRLNDLAGPRVIISSSGMMTGGRVLHHLRRLLPNARNTILLAGYQAPGTRGWRLARGESAIRIHGREVQVAASIRSVSGLSAHADADELFRWVRSLSPPRKTFVTHGEPRSARAFAQRLYQELGFDCETPHLGDRYALS